MRRFAVVGSLLVALALACGGVRPSPPPESEARTSSDIIGGRQDQGDPAVVGVLVIDSSSGMSSTCTGEIIAPTLVLTAAHCVNPGDLNEEGLFPDTREVVTSATFDSATDDDIFEVVAWTAHPDYVMETGDHDVAVLQLDRPTPIAPLPYAHDVSRLEGAPVRAVGYGRTVDGEADTVGTKKSVRLTVSDMTSSVFTLVSSAGTQCHGDSGGPTLATIDGTETIVGLCWHSVDPKGSCLQGGTDERVDVFASWIDEMIAN